MRYLTPPAAGLLLLALSGCMSTRCVEQSRIITTGVGPDGCLSWTREASQTERCWKGPWLAQPEQIRP